MKITLHVSYLFIVKFDMRSDQTFLVITDEGVPELEQETQT